MNMFLARINITIDTEENEIEVRKQLEYASAEHVLNLY